MEHRVLGRTGRVVSVIGLGTWQLGGDWGDVSDAEAFETLEAAVTCGITLFDTADVYGDGRSEQLIGRFLRANPSLRVMVSTKMGRREALVPANFTLPKFRRWVDRSRQNLGTDRLDLIQLHCPPTEIYSRDAVFDDLDTLVESGAVAAYGVSVETCEEALEAIARPHVATVQIILNAFRLKPLEKVLPAASAAGVGIIARVPLASGMLSGRYSWSTTFPENDHRNYNREGAAFDVGETFSGVPYDIGVRAAREFGSLVMRRLGPEIPPAQAALEWVWQQPGVSTVIPGARSPEQVRLNARAGSGDVLGPLFSYGVREIYDDMIREHVHDRW